MRFTFIQPASFAAAWKRLRLNDEDLRELENQISARPEAGVVIRGAGGLRKLRFAPPSWRTGKSGATRVCYVVFDVAAKVYLLMIFTKNEKSNLTPADVAHARRWVAALRSQVEEEE